MKVSFEAVLDGFAKFIDKNIYTGMNDWQELFARVLVGRIFDARENLKSAFVNNGFIRTFGIIDENGNIDVESLAKDIKKEIQRKGKITVGIPMFGQMTFVPEDVDALYNMIGDVSENENTQKSHYVKPDQGGCI